MAELLEADCDTLSPEIDDCENRRRVLTSGPSPTSPIAPIVSAAPQPVSPPPAAATAQRAGADWSHCRDALGTARHGSFAAGDERAAEVGAAPIPAGSDAERLQGHIVSPAPTTERLQSISAHGGRPVGRQAADFRANALRAIPVQVGGLYPISDVWYIEPGLDVPDRLRCISRSSPARSPRRRR